jgi:cation diffusion facilitator CzcD-associated flavoprotein CzcO
VRVAIVGSGFSGLGMAIGLKRAGIHDFVLFERATQLGGTWRDNTYPGCQCDVPSHLYSFSFHPNPNWTRTYSTQGEILEYLRGCAAENDVVDRIRFDHRVTSARWNDDENAWMLETNQGLWVADVVIAAHGGLAEPAFPDIVGLEDFDGEVMHSAAWKPEVDLAGKRVAVVGTGASAIQIVPELQPIVEKLHVFQRTPTWVLPHTDRPIRDWERRLYRRVPLAQKLVRSAIYFGREYLAFGMTRDRRFLRPLERIAKGHLRRQVPDRDLRRKLRPRFELGCKRILLSNRFYPAVAAANSELITEAVRELRGSKIVGSQGTERDVDVVIFATGFHVVDNPTAETVTGRTGSSLADHWKRQGMGAYLGTTVDTFPNLFLMTGPNTGIGHTSLVVMIEAQIRYIVDALQTMSKARLASVEVRESAVSAFNEELQTKMQGTVWTTGGCQSWYLDEQGRNPTLWPDFTWRFKRATRRFDPAAYLLTPSRTAAMPGPRGRAGTSLSEVSAANAR